MGAGYDKQSVLSAYAESKNIKAVCEKTGAPPYIAYIWLRKAGVLTSDEKTRYGTAQSRRGAMAESEFKRLVPDAMDANAHLSACNHMFDFCVGEFTIDVKSSLQRDRKWRFRTAFDKPFQPDFYCLFGALGENGVSDGYRLFLIPSDMVPDRRYIFVDVDVRKNKWRDFEVDREALGEALHAADGDIKEGA